MNGPCEVCGAPIRSQGDYTYCPREGLVGHIEAKRKLAESKARDWAGYE